MRKSYKFKKREKEDKKFACNNQIQSPELAVIDEEGNQLGTMDRARALALAEERGYDLVEVMPNATPPIAKFINFGSFQYHREKQQKKQQKMNKTLEMKKMRISSHIGDHDQEVKAIQTEKFLERGHQVKIELILHGREMQHQDLARQAVIDFRKKIKFPCKLEQELTKQGTKIFLILSPDKSTN